MPCISVVVLDKRPITHGRKIDARLSRVQETARQFCENFSVFVSYEVTVPVDSGHASHAAVRSQRFRSFVLKPLTKSKSFKFHISSTYVLSSASAAARRYGVSISLMFFHSL
jgi:hypothetical protein